MTGLFGHFPESAAKPPRYQQIVGDFVAVVQLGTIQKSADDFALGFGVIEDHHRPGQFDEQLAEGGSGVISHPFDLFDVGQSKFVAHILSHPPTRFTDQEVHQLEGFGTRWIFDVNTPRHLSRKHGFCVIMGAISSNLYCLCHKTELSVRISVCQFVDIVPISVFSVPISVFCTLKSLKTKDEIRLN